MSELPIPSNKAGKVFDLDPLSVQSNRTLGINDHVAVAVKKIRNTCGLEMEEYLCDRDIPESEKSKVLLCYLELDGFLTGIEQQKITTGQPLIRELFHQLVVLIPANEYELKHALSDCLKDCIAVGACTEDQELGFCVEYRRQCQEAGVTEPSPGHVGRLR